MANKPFLLLVARDNWLPWQQEQLSISQIFVGVKSSNLVDDGQRVIPVLGC